MDDSASAPESKKTSENKIASNRENAARSTGPRTVRGKANSRTNALKHGILASQAVIATIEGREERAMFDQMSDGLAADLQPEGTLEQLLLQQVAACFWRYRRLLQFENRAAFATVDARTGAEMNRIHSPIGHHRALYAMDKQFVEAEDVYEDAGLETLTLPNERDTTRVVRYEATITRTMNRALSKLEAMRKTRQAEAKAAGTGIGGEAAPREEHPVVIDEAARARNRKAGAKMLAPMVGLKVKLGILQISQAERAAEEVAAKAKSGASAAPANSTQNDQTKPNTPANPQDQLAAVLADLAKFQTHNGSNGTPSA